MVTVIIPALNESATIASVIKFCFANEHVSEVIVVDDNSADDTVAVSRKEGAKVIHSAIRGKGISMKEGIRAAENELLVFLDGDIDPYPAQTMERLIDPLLQDRADFVKATFSRNAGRVTELVAKPLLTIFYPGLAHFSQPLSGMIAGRKQFFERIEFFSGYGVDIGILIDMFLMQARISEVEIGHIENKSRPWQELGKMSREVTRAIIEKALRHNKQLVNLNQLELVNIISSEMKSVVVDEVSHLKKMVVFDLDNAIFKESYFDLAAKRFGFTEQLEQLRQNVKDSSTFTKRVALLFEGIAMEDLLQCAADLRLKSDIKEVVRELKSRGYMVGIISDGFHIVSEYIKNKIGADFHLAHQLEYFEGRATGEVRLPSYFYHTEESTCKHPICKTNALRHLSKRYDIALENCIAVGDKDSDRCMVETAGMGVAFCTTSSLLKYVADKEISATSFEDILAFAD